MRLVVCCFAAVLIVQKASAGTFALFERSKIKPKPLSFFVGQATDKLRCRFGGW